jgi:hypothetical protein
VQKIVQRRAPDFKTGGRIGGSHVGWNQERKSEQADKTGRESHHHSRKKFCSARR